MITFSGSRTMRVSAINIFLRNLPKKLASKYQYKVNRTKPTKNNK